MSMASLKEKTLIAVIGDEVSYFGAIVTTRTSSPTGLDHGPPLGRYRAYQSTAEQELSHRGL
jgi:hypothetical protein